MTTLPAGSAAVPIVDAAERPWWVRPGLEIVDGRLAIAGRDAEALAREHGTPLFVYDRLRFVENAERLIAALDRAGLRHPAPLRAQGEPGPDDPRRPPRARRDRRVLPGEVLRALECGWTAGEISYTGTNVSERDLDVILAQPLHLNLDAVSQIERVGRRLAALGPGDPRPRSFGIRINPAAGAGYNETLAYSGARPTKFGIYEDRLDEALAAAGRHGIELSTLHVHVGSGWLADGVPAFEAAIARVAEITRRLRARVTRSARSTSAAGSASPPGRTSEPIDPDAYAAAIRRALGDLVERASSSAASPATISPRTPPSSSARSSRSRSGAGRPSSGSISAGTSTARTSSIGTPRSSSPVPRPTRSGRSASRSPATSTRRATSSPRTTRCHRSGRATSWRCSTPAATTRR